RIRWYSESVDGLSVGPRESSHCKRPEQAAALPSTTARAPNLAIPTTPKSRGRLCEPYAPRSMNRICAPQRRWADSRGVRIGEPLVTCAVRLNIDVVRLPPVESSDTRYARSG